MHESKDNTAVRVTDSVSVSPEVKSRNGAYGHRQFNSAELQNIFREVTEALRSMRYGSILLTVHEGQVVEVSKTMRLRTKPPARG